MRYIYIIVAKKLLFDDQPPVKVDHGFMAAQVHHATVKACDAGFDIDAEEDAVVVLQVKNSDELLKLGLKLASKCGVQAYVETSHRFKGCIMTALITEPVSKMRLLRKYKLWK